MPDRIIGRLAYKIVGDDRELSRALRRSVRELDKTADRFQQIGGRLSTFVTAPIVAAGGAAAKAASDLNESLNAVNVVFDESAEQITAWGQNAATQAGLAQSEFNQAAVRLGASLKNAGIPVDDLADSTIELTQRAADLASVFNTDVNDALSAIASALRGEADPIERFGATVNAAAVEAKALELGLAATRSEITEQIKVQARLAVIMEQTAEVQGDFARTAGEAANQTRIARAQVQDQAAALGQQLLPIWQAIISEALELISAFNELDESQKRLIIQIAASAAAMGPLSVAIGTTIKAVNTLRLALVALGGTSGFGLLLVAAAAVATAIHAISEPSREARESLADLAEQSGITARELDGVARALSEAEHFAQSIDDAEEAVRQIADASGRTVAEVLEIGIASSRIGDEFRAHLELIQEQNALHEDQVEDMRQLRDLQRHRALAARDERVEQEAITAELERQQLHQQTWEEYWEGINQQWRDLGANTEVYRRNLEAIAEVEDPDQRRRLLQEMERMLDLNAGMLTQEQAFPVTAAARLGLLKEIRVLLAGITQEGEAQKKVADDLKDSTEAQRNLVADYNKRYGELAEVVVSIAHDSQDWTAEFESLASQAGRAWGGIFSGVGQAIIDTEAGLESIGRAMANLFTGILETLGQQFAAMAAAALFGMPPTFIPNPGQAAAYGAASAGFFAASGLAGAISAFGEGGSFLANQPTLALFGENGPETVDIQPVKHPGVPGAYAGGQSIHIHGDVYGYDDFARKVEQAGRRSNRLGRTGR